MRGRAFRRAQRTRWKHRVINMWRDIGAKGTEHWINKLVNTRHPCSCYGCGNARRRADELAIQELRHDVDKDPRLELE